MKTVTIDENSNCLASVYGWMSVGLIITAIVAMVSVASGLTALISHNKLLLLIISLMTLVPLLAVSVADYKQNGKQAATFFVIYTAMTGLTLSTLYYKYTEASIAGTFLVSAVMFLLTSTYGATTKRDLSTVGSLCTMGLIGGLVAMVCGSLFDWSGLQYVTTYILLVVFIGLIAYDSQKYKNAVGSQAVVGALELYLDFINLFLLLLRLCGTKDED